MSSLATCIFNKKHKMKAINKINHESTCPDRHLSTSPNAISCPFNSYHKVLSENILSHKEVCVNKPIKSLERANLELDIRNHINKENKQSTKSNIQNEENNKRTIVKTEKIEKRNNNLIKNLEEIVNFDDDFNYNYNNNHFDEKYDSIFKEQVVEAHMDNNEVNELDVYDPNNDDY